MVQGGKDAAHQLSRVNGSLPGLQMLLQGQEEHPHPVKNGQHAGNCLHQQDGVDSVPCPKQSEQRLWLWCMERDISVQVQHLAGTLSRQMKDRYNRRLCPQTFQAIDSKFGPLEVDFFMSRLTTQLLTFVSWRPESEAMMTDAFTVTWTDMKANANPPWSLVGRVLEMCTDYPWIILGKHNLIQPSHSLVMPLIIPQLAVWIISGDITRSSSFRRKLQSSCSRHGERNPMTHNSRNDLADIVLSCSSCRETAKILCGQHNARCTTCVLTSSSGPEDDWSI